MLLGFFFILGDKKKLDIAEYLRKTKKDFSLQVNDFFFQKILHYVHIKIFFKKFKIEILLHSN